MIQSGSKNRSPISYNYLFFCSFFCSCYKTRVPGKKILSVRQRFYTKSLPRLESGSRSRTSPVPGVLSRGGSTGTPRPPTICKGPPGWTPSHFSSSCRCPGGVACCPDGSSPLRTSSAGRPYGSGTAGSEEGTDRRRGSELGTHTPSC